MLLQLRSLYAGDTRQAMAPLLAHKALKGSYKWLVFGDDDTVFFTDAIRNLVQDFDHDMPYAISGKSPYVTSLTAPLKGGICRVAADCNVLLSLAPTADMFA